MPLLEMVYDLELLTRLSLTGNELQGWKRIAYFAGLVSGLRIAKKFAETDVTFFDARLDAVLNGATFPAPTVAELARLISKYTEPHVMIDLNFFEETGLRHGPSGIKYLMGMRDAFKVGIKQAPLMFEFFSDDAQKELVKWLAGKIEWAEKCLEYEKNIGFMDNIYG